MYNPRHSFKVRQRENMASTDKFQGFEAWLREHGSQFELVSRQADMLRCARARRDRQAGMTTIGFVL